MSCPLCHHNLNKHLLETNSWSLVGCQQCDLIYCPQIPLKVQRHSEDISAQKQQIYEDQFYKKYGPPLLKYLTPKSRWLDIGCGTGHFLELAASKGVIAHGIEMNKDRFKIAQKRHNISVDYGTIRNLSVNESFDGILMCNVFSHLDFNKKEWSTALDAVKPGGLMILITGEIDRNITLRSMPDWGIPEHRQFLGLNTITYFTQHNPWQLIHHERFPMIDEWFSDHYLLSPGRSHIKNILKKGMYYWPWLKHAIKGLYKWYRGNDIHQSFIVLKKKRSD